MPGIPLWEDSMRNRFTRREFGGLLASGVALAAFGSTGRSAHAESRLRFIWWGNPDRDKRTLAAIDLYNKKHPEIAVDPESYALGRLLAEARHPGGGAESRRH